MTLSHYSDYCFSLLLRHCSPPCCRHAAYCFDAAFAAAAAIISIDAITFFDYACDAISLILSLSLFAIDGCR